MKKRVVTGLFLGLVLIPAIYFGGIFYTIIALALVGVGTYEIMNMFNKKSNRLNKMKYVIPMFSVIVSAMLFRAENIVSENIDFIFSSVGIDYVLNGGIVSTEFYLGNLSLAFLVYILFVIVILIINIFIKNSDSNDILACIMSLTYGGLLLGSAFALEFSEPILSDGISLWGGMLFAYAYIVILCTDMFAYFIGCKFGKHRLCPKISPKKSVEGAIGGLVCGSLIGVLACYLFGIVPFSLGEGFIEKFSYFVIVFFVSCIISVIGQIGDLVASKLKRSYDIKDYSNIFPGHGGVLDRFDSLLLAGSFVYVLYIVFRMFILGVIL
jgi:phosphatidate cytidylyltransferase